MAGAHSLDHPPSGGPGRKRLGMLVAGSVTILAASALIFLVRPASDDAAPRPAAEPRATGSPGFGAARPASAGEIRAYLNDMFDRLDRDGSGAVDPAEAPRLQVISVRLDDGTLRPLRLTQAEWIDRGDGDRDGRVTRTEYFARLVPPVQGIFGVPPDWQPGGARATKPQE